MNDGLPTVMFVDDEPSVLQGLRRLFRSKKDCWRMLFANSGNDALALMSHSQVDVLVTDMRMPGMDGAELPFSNCADNHSDHLNATRSLCYVRSASAINTSPSLAIALS